MRHRYLLTKEGTANDLVIKEYAVIGQDPRQKQELLAFEDDYTFICQENYDGDLIMASISKGENDLIATLRTEQLFPIRILAEKIAELVMDLYTFSEDRSTELFFNDCDQFKDN